MGKNEVLVSIVIPTYNRSELIKRTINSVLAQTYTNFELIIVDDASTDNTEDIVNEYHDDRIKFIKLNGNSKGTKPRNVGIKESKGEYIALLDSDDEWLPNKLENQLNFMRTFNDDSLVCFTDLILKGTKKTVYSNNRALFEEEDILEYIFLGKNWVQTSTYMFSSKLGKQTLFNPTLKKHQDWDFCLRLKKNGAKFVNFPEHLAIYYSDDREGRIGNNLKYKQSLEWINSVSNDISNEVKHAFLVRVMTKPLIFNKQRNKALSIYLDGKKNGVIGLSALGKGIIKCFMPLSIYRIIVKLKG
ncbi:glycosyltransferase family 2 protein [Bacillus cereus]|uniref:glycosyltransferase family 2 protein n=1 Tax=Bacillus cereus TaxID=1396 RepID=UPI0018F3B1C2|nr:glycosyltransferase family 2 protein [Bacillus cereus]MBJ8051876.1 glycosyltransferase family 2 protein [Bacillus cereus]